MLTTLASRKATYVLLLTALIAGAGTAKADNELGGPNIDAGHFSIGGRGAYFDPKSGDAKWYGGGQVRWHMTHIFALEAAADIRQTDVGASKVNVYPVQASLLGYLMPGKRVSPYVLAGANWNFTTIDNPEPAGDETDHRFGVHAGAGLQFFLNKHWSIDGSYRYLWVDNVEVKDATLNPSEYQDEGHMFTAALNLHF